MSDKSATLNVIGLALKVALKDENDSLKSLIRCQQTVEGLSEAIKALGGDPAAVSAEAKTPRTTVAMTKKAEAAVAEATGAATEEAPKKTTPVKEAEAEEAPDDQTVAEETAEADPDAYDPDDEKCQERMSKVRAIAAKLANEHGMKDDVKKLLAAKGFKKFEELNMPQLAGVGKKMQQMVKDAEAAEAAAAAAAAEAEGSAPLPEDDW